MSSISVFFKSKFFILGVVFLAVIMTITNPGRFTFDYIFSSFVPEEQSYSNFSLFSYGTEKGYVIMIGRGVRHDPKVSVKYISMFNNYFCFMSADDGKTSKLQVISK